MAVRKKMAITKGVELTKRDRSTFEKQMSNWQITRKFLKARKNTPQLLLKMVTFECEQVAPRESMLRNLVQRYNSSRRKEVEEQLAKFVENPCVARSVSRTKP